ncbi:MAG TPA: hypothetical protein VFI34_07275 [Candidatus Limnocylindrales bacterium]|nr:hypothetical protein [Candidatus Limnocylindrales bacterium]
MSRRLLALVGAGLLSLWVATGAFAKVPPGTVSVETTGCSFMVHIAWEQAQPVTTWKVKVFDAANWKDGETLIKDQALDDADGKIDGGPYTLPEGHYNVAVDNEATVDGSSIVVDFVLTCPTTAPSTSPSGEELPAGGTPSTSPSGQELPAEGTPSTSPTGEELPAVGAGQITPPPTDTAATAGATGNGTSGAWLTLAALSALALVVLTASTRRLGAARSVKVETGRRR